MFSLLFGVGVALMRCIEGEFFQVMSPIVSFVSSAITFWALDLARPRPEYPLQPVEILDV
jgi:hypothetical protein